MSVSVLYTGRPPFAGAAEADSENLWLRAADLPAATGWELRPEGVCRGDACVPIPRGREAEFLRDGRARVNVAALARTLGRPVVHDDTFGVWVIGEAAQARREALGSLEAPDFTLPDLDGRRHSLADYRGRKVLLVSWASW